MTKKMEFLVMSGITATLVDKIFKVASNANDEIIFEFGNKKCNAKDGIKLYQLGIGYNSEVMVTTKDEDAINKIELLFKGSEMEV